MNSCIVLSETCSCVASKFPDKLECDVGALRAAGYLIHVTPLELLLQEVNKVHRSTKHQHEERVLIALHAGSRCNAYQIWYLSEAGYRQQN